MSPPKRSLIALMKEEGYFLTNRNSWSLFYETREYFAGLPELAQFWLVRSQGIWSVRRGKDENLAVPWMWCKQFSVSSHCTDHPVGIHAWAVCHSGQC